MPPMQTELEEFIEDLSNTSSPREIKDTSDKIKSLRADIRDPKENITKAAEDEDQDIPAILTAFGRNMNVMVKVSDQVAVRRIRGRLPVDGAVPHISGTTEVRTELLDIGPANPGGVNEKLQALGIADPRYAIRSTSDSRILSVSGPPPYLALIRQTVAAMQKAALPRSAREVQDGDEVRVRVFRGKTGEGS